MGRCRYAPRWIFGVDLGREGCLELGQQIGRALDRVMDRKTDTE